MRRMLPAYAQSRVARCARLDCLMTGCMSRIWSGSSGPDSMSANIVRYCHCGMRLAGDHAGARCGVCERRAIEQRVGPPAVPAGFWDTAAFSDAFDAQHMGRVARAYRRHPFNVAVYGRDGIPQGLLGEWLGLTQAQISRIENGPPIRNLDTLAHWAGVLGIPPDRLWFKMRGGQSRSDGAAPVPACPTDVPLVPMPPASPFRLVVIGDGALCDAAVMQAFRSADLQAGGGHLYASVVKYLQDEVAPRLFGCEDAADSRAVFTAAAALTEMAGWMAREAGRDAVAGQHFSRSLALAQLSGDRQLHAHVLGSMSHLASHLGQPDEAIDLARQGQTMLRTGPANGQITARLFALEARGYAGQASKKAECVGTLLQAERTLQDRGADQASPWVSHFDQASLASEATWCMLQLGDLAEARRQAEAIVTIRPSHRTRSRAFGQLALATVLVAQGKPDEACGIGYDVLAATQSLCSYPVIRQLLELRQVLAQHRNSATVAGFLACLQDAVTERLRLYPWLIKDGRTHDRGREGT